MTYASAHRLRCGDKIIGASGGQEWALKEPEPGVPLAPLDCFFPVLNESQLHGSLDVWLFRTEKGGELWREEWIGTITFVPGLCCQRDCWIGSQEHLMMRIHLDGHGVDTGNRCRCGTITPVGWDECQTCWAKGIPGQGR